jgi:hypothetical protein
MSLTEFKTAIESKSLICPKCKNAILKFDKYAETIDAVRDGFNIQEIDSHGVRVTLICANEGCTWKERTEYWENFLKD